MDYRDKLPPSPWDTFAPPRRYIFTPPLTVLVPPGDVDALADALRRVLTDARLRERLTAGAARFRLPTWEQQAQRFASVLEGVGRIEVAGPW